MVRNPKRSRANPIHPGRVRYSMIYVIQNDGRKFLEFDLSIDSLIDRIPEHIPEHDIFNFSYSNLELNPYWEQCEASFSPIEGIQGTVPDLCCWNGSNLVLSPKVFASIAELISPFGELLPVTVGGLTYHIFNCRTFGRIDEINSKRNVIDSIDMGAAKIAFNKEDVKDKLIFKTKVNACLDPFCSDILKNKIELDRLTGVIFGTDLAADF